VTAAVAAAQTETLLECRGLHAGYGQMAVVRDLDLRVGAGEVVALIGANGAGKTTSLLTLAGDLPPLQGEVHFLGALTKAPLHRRARAGLGFVTEEKSVIMELTAAENLRLAAVPISAATDLFPELKVLLNRPAGLLSGGEQQMLTLARALGRAPRVLLADELSLGLAPLVVRRLLAAVRQATYDRGIGVLLVEQHVRQALEIADRVYVMQRGRITLSGTADQLKDQLTQIEASYLEARTDTTSDPPVPDGH
jgi:branched-chain amino acid transport system ATP-binding protein